MRKILFILLFSLGSLVLIAQDSTQYDKGVYNLSMWASFGRGFWGESFHNSYIAPSFSHQLNDFSNIRAGVMLGNTSIYMPRKTEDKAPYADSYRRNAAYIGFDFEVNPKTIISITAFYDQASPMSSPLRMGDNLRAYGLNANLNYQISEKSFFNLNISYTESNNPYMLFSSPYSPYGFSPYSIGMPAFYGVNKYGLGGW